MKIVYHKIKKNNKEIILKLMTFDKKDKKIFKKTFKKYQSINKILKNKLKATRIMNFPDALSESIFCLEMNCGKLLGAEKSSGYSTSFDAYDMQKEKRIQIKCSASSGPSSFGPRSQYDEIYFIDFANKGFVDGNYKIYMLKNEDIDNVKVNKKQKLTDQQQQDRRPRFEIRNAIIIKKKLKPVCEGKL